jgi:hypothetical protein
MFTNAKSKWLPLLQCLYNLNSKKLGFDIPFDKLEAKHIPNLILSDPITCAQYYDHCMKCIHKLGMKAANIFLTFNIFFLVTKFQR